MTNSIIVTDLKTKFCVFYRFINPKHEQDFKQFFFRQSKDYFMKQLVIATVVSVALLTCCVIIWEDTHDTPTKVENILASGGDVNATSTTTTAVNATEMHHQNRLLNETSSTDAIREEPCALTATR